MRETVATAPIEVTTGESTLPPHADVVAAAVRKAKCAQVRKILGDGAGKGKRARRDAVSDRQHAALKRAAERFFVPKSSKTPRAS